MNRDATGAKAPADLNGRRGEPAADKKSTIESAAADEKSTIESAAGKVTVALVSQVAVLAALLYYFGWSRTEALLNYYGLDSTVVDLSTKDYVLRGVRPITPIVVGAGFVTLVAVSVHRNVVAPSLLARGRRQELVLLFCGPVRLLCWLGLAFVAGSLLFVPDGSRVVGVIQPILLASASLTLLYTDQVRAQVDSGTHASRQPVPVDLRRYSLVGLSAVGLIWSLAVYAAISGQASAVATAAQGERPDVVVRSTEQLMIDQPGVSETPITVPGSKFRYTYHQIRVLLRAAGKYYLVPAEWRPGAGSVAIITDNDSVQIDVLG